MAATEPNASDPGLEVVVEQPVVSPGTSVPQGDASALLQDLPRGLPQGLPLGLPQGLQRAKRGKPTPPNRLWVRAGLLAIALGWGAVFAIAMMLNPYTADGRPRGQGTHMQLGLPPCNMVTLTGYPCPACGMTTSFSLLMHGDLSASWRANWAGTVTAIYGLILLPWAVLGLVRGHLLGLRSFEPAFTLSVVGFLALSLGRWIWVVWRTG